MGSRDDFLGREYLNTWLDAGVESASIKPPRLRAAKKTRPTPAASSVAVKTLDDVRNWIGECKRCGLCQERQSIVFGDGNPKTRLLFVGEGPGADEDRQGLPFVGRAGQLLNKIIEAMEFQRKDVYIANIVKCRPPGNRQPEQGEIAACLPFLKAQIAIIKPEYIVALGATAVGALLNHQGPMASIRGKFQKLAWEPGTPVMPTYHPAYLLRNPPAKKFVWEDMKKVMAKMNG